MDSVFRFLCNHMDICGHHYDAECDYDGPTSIYCEHAPDGHATFRDPNEKRAGLNPNKIISNALPGVYSE